MYVFYPAICGNDCEYRSWSFIASPAGGTGITLGRNLVAPRSHNSHIEFGRNRNPTCLGYLGQLVLNSLGWQQQPQQRLPSLCWAGVRRQMFPQLWRKGRCVECHVEGVTIMFYSGLSTQYTDHILCY